MNDADILVRPGHFVRTMGIVVRHGFAPVSGVGSGPRGFRTFHAIAFRDSTGIDIDLHHHMLEECNWRDADVGLWERSSSASFGEATVRYPAPEDLLINLCVHGVRWDPVPPVRWIADATLLVREQPIDWTLVLSESARRGVTIAVEAALREVNRFEPVPEWVLDALAQTPSGWLERLDFRAQQGGISAPGMVARYVTRYLRLSSRRGPWQRARSFPTYLQGMWELETPGDVPREGVRRIAARLRGRQPGRGPQRPAASRNGKISA
jgi:hypothetical protein